MAARTCAGSIAWTLASLNSNLNEGAPPFSAAVRRADMDSHTNQSGGRRNGRPPSLNSNHLSGASRLRA